MQEADTGCGLPMAKTGAYGHVICGCGGFDWWGGGTTEGVIAEAQSYVKRRRTEPRSCSCHPRLEITYTLEVDALGVAA